MLVPQIIADLVQQPCVSVEVVDHGYCVHLNAVATALLSDRVKAIKIIPKATSSTRYSGRSLLADRLPKKREAPMRSELVVFMFRPSFH
jgi:hypothetical protein